MITKSSVINKSIFLNSLKGCWWIGIVYTLILFMLLPFQIMTLSSGNKTQINNIFFFNGKGFQEIIILLLPVILGTYLFRYIQNNAYSDMMHSFPVRITSLYISNIFVGSCVLILPAAITGLFALLLNAVLGLQNCYNFFDIFQWTGITILINLVFFFSSVFIAMIVENSIFQVVLTYILIILPAGLITLIKANINILFHGFISNVSHTIYPETGVFMPIIRILKGFNASNNSIGLFEVISYILMCLLLYFLAKLLYKHRKLEGTSEAISSPLFRYIFKYLLTFSTMLLVGIFYFDFPGQVNCKIALGYFIGSLFSYISAEMLIKKSLLAFRNIKGYLIYFCIAFIAYITVILFK